MPTIQYCFKKIIHRISATDVHSICTDSQIVNNLFKNAFAGNINYYAFRDISKILISNKQLFNSESDKTIPLQHAKLLFRIINHIQPESILEVAPENVITSLYLATAHSKIPVNCLTQSAALLQKQLEVAQKNIAVKNISILNSKESEIEKNFVKHARRHNFVVCHIPLHHLKKQTINQIIAEQNSNSILVFTKLYHNPQSSATWHRITNKPEEVISIDLFHIGILILQKNKKMHLKVKL